MLPPAIWLTRRVAQMRREITAQRQRELADLNVTIEEGLSISGVQLSKTLGAGPALVDRFTASSARLVDLELRSELAGRWRMADQRHLRRHPGGDLPRRGAARHRRHAEHRHPGRLHRPPGRAVPPADGAAQRRRLVVSLAGAVRPDLRVPRPARRGGRPGPPGAGRPGPGARPRPLRGRHLQLPRQRHRNAVDRRRLDVPAGTSLALVGETGSGKSTLAALVSRLHDPDAGRITIDGVDLRDLRLADLAAIVGVVSQETYLLHTTVRENLRYARPDATDAEMEDAARAAQIHDLIAALPDGYDTVVGSRGHRFSGGEKQRLAIARTLLRDPRVLVLDEATSALDTETERAVQRAFDALAAGRTMITIAHRLSTVRDADQIVVLDHGRIVESGTHRACSPPPAGTPPWPPDRVENDLGGEVGRKG